MAEPLTARERRLLERALEHGDSPMAILDPRGTVLFVAGGVDAELRAALDGIAHDALACKRLAVALRVSGRLPFGLMLQGGGRLTGAITALTDVIGTPLVLLHLGRPAQEPVFHALTTRLDSLNAAMAQRSRENTIMRQVFDATLEGVVIADRQGRVLSCNARMEQMVGPVTDLRDLFADAAVADQVLAADPGTIPLDRIERVALRGIAGRGDDRVANLNIGRTATVDQPILVLVFHEISDVLRLEVADRELKAAQAREEAKTRFLGMISHELRTPMHGAIAALEMLDQHSWDEETRTLLRIAISSSEAALEQVNRILELTRLEARIGGDAVREPFSPAEIIQQVIEQQQAYASQRANVVRLLIDAEPGMAVLGDGYLFRQIAQNLIGNALKFTKAGMVFVTLRMSLTADGQARLAFSVKDTGKGFDLAQKDRLLQEFETGNSQYSRIEEGAGLGLALVGKAVAHMHGQLEIDSLPGVGSSFTVRLPFDLAQAVQTATPVVAPGDPQVRDLSVLAVDDNDINRFMLEKQLQRQGCRVVTAADGAAALSLLQRQRFDLVFMDVSMPGMDGIEVTRRFRASAEAHPVQVIGLTAHAGPDVHQSCLEAGMDRVMVKPFKMVDLTALLATLGPTRQGDSPALI